MAQATNTADGDFLAWADARADQRRVGGDTGAKKGRCVGGRKSIWDLEGKVFVGTDVVGVAAVRPTAILILRIVGILRTEMSAKETYRKGSANVEPFHMFLFSFLLSFLL